MVFQVSSSLSFDAERGKSPKLKIVKLAIFWPKMAFFSQKNDHNFWNFDLPKKPSRGVVGLTESYSLRYVSGFEPGGKGWDFYFFWSKYQLLHRGDPIQNIFFLKKSKISDFYIS